MNSENSPFKLQMKRSQFMLILKDVPFDCLKLQFLTLRLSLLWWLHWSLWLVHLKCSFKCDWFVWLFNYNQVCSQAFYRFMCFPDVGKDCELLCHGWSGWRVETACNWFWTTHDVVFQCLENVCQCGLSSLFHLFRSSCIVCRLSLHSMQVILANDIAEMYFLSSVIGHKFWAFS